MAQIYGRVVKKGQPTEQNYKIYLIACRIPSDGCLEPGPVLYFTTTTLIIFIKNIKFNARVAAPV